MVDRYMGCDCEAARSGLGEVTEVARLSTELELAPVGSWGSRQPGSQGFGIGT